MASHPSILNAARSGHDWGSAEFLTSDIIRYISKRMNVPEARIKPHSRLVQDLGMTADEALDFFEDFSRDYHVNLDSLFSRYWQRHFGGHGMGLDTLLSLFLCAAPAGFLAGFGVSLDGWLLYCSLILFWGIAMRGWPFFRRQECAVPIRPRDLAISVRLGRWYEPPSGRKRPLLLKPRPRWAHPAAQH